MYCTLYTSADDYTKPKEVNICIICLTDKSTNLFQNFTNYILDCDCNAYIHKSCFEEWYTKTKSCPICRKRINYNSSIIHYIKNLQLLQNYITICNHIYFLIRTIYFIKVVLVIMYCISVVAYINIAFL